MRFDVKYILVGLSYTLLLNCSLVAGEKDGAIAGVIEGRDTKGMAIELVSEVKSIKSGEPFRVGLSIKHDKGFHTYWKSPGVVGMPTGVKWELPEGFEVSELHWPYPELSMMINYPCFGYERNVLLYVIITPPKMIEAKNVSISANVNWMCCADTCHPGFKKLNLNLRLGDGKLDESKVKLFDKTTAELPKESDEIKAKLMSAYDAQQIIVEITSSKEEVLEAVFNSDGQTTPDLDHSLKKISEGTWLFKAERSEYGSNSKTFPFVVKIATGYIKVIAK